MKGLEALQNFNSAPLQGGRAHRSHHAEHAHGKDNDAKKLTDASTALQQYSLSESYGQQRSFEMQIKTRDGDTVTIKVDAEQLQSVIASQRKDASGSTTQARYAEKNSLKFSYSVKGELDGDEQKALDALFSDANKLADSFYAGNVEDAFKQASAMQFNSDEIASFSLKMSQQEAYSKTEAYQEIQDQTAGSEPAESKAANNPNELFRKLGKFLFDAAQFLQKHADEASNNAQAKELLKQLPAEEETKNKWQEFLAGAFKNLV